MKDKKEQFSFKLNTSSLWLGMRSQDVSDAIRNTITIIIPFAIFFELGFPAAAIGIGTGTLLISATDLPGNRSDKLNGAWRALLVFAITSLLMAFVFNNFLLLSFFMFSLTFVFAMFGVFGPRMASIGVMATILATFTIGLRPEQPLMYAVYITIGGAWYYLVSNLQVWIFPYYPLERSLLKCKKNTAELMRLRAKAYDISTPLTGFNAQNIRLHVKLTIEHELMRKLLLGDKWAGKNSDKKSKQLLHQSLILIDLYEKVNAIHHDYSQLRELFKNGGALIKINRAINTLANILENKSSDFLSVDSYVDFLEKMVSDDEVGQLLNKLVGNLKETSSLINSLYQSPQQKEELILETFLLFLPPSIPPFIKLKSHLHLKSPIFRFALRIALVVLIAIVFVQLLSAKDYGYWLPLTLIVVSRPSYGMTRNRNWERFFGTLSGLILSWVLIKLELPVSVQLVISVMFMFLFFSFYFVKYWVSSLCITVSVVLCLSIYHGNMEDIFLNRLSFTLLGCVLGIMATLVFPIWHSKKLGILLDQSIDANLAYLVAVKEMSTISMNQMRLARKQAYLTLSALNEAVTLSNSEPFWRRHNLLGVKQMELLNFQLNALIGAYSLAKVQGNDDYIETDLIEVIANLRKCTQTSLGDDISMIDKPLNQLCLITVSNRLKEFYDANP